MISVTGVLKESLKQIKEKRKKTNRKLYKGTYTKFEEISNCLINH